MGCLKLVVVVVVFLLDALVGGRGALLLEIFAKGTVDVFFEDGLGFNRLELGLEVLHLEDGGVASTTSVGQIVTHVFDFVALTAPVEQSCVSNYLIVSHRWNAS